jgi:transcription termination factor Rho
MSVLDRAALEESPLADLHTIASELSLDGYRRLRKAELIDAILGRQGGDAGGSAPDADSSAAAEADLDADADADGDAPAAETQSDDEPAKPRRRGRRGGRTRAGARDEDAAKDDEPADDEPEPEPERAPKPRTRTRSRARDSERTQDRDSERTRDRDSERTRDRDPERTRDRDSDRSRSRDPEPAAVEEDEIVEGVVELLPNGSGFVRVKPPEPSDDDVYVSAAQVKRCELVSGDRVTGPRRSPRRSERFASLVRVDTINDQPASELASGTRFEDLPAAFPTERFRLGSEDPTVKAIEWLTPFGKGSRVAIIGASRAGKSEALRRLATVLAAQDDVQVSVALAGVRPEEISVWSDDGLAPPSPVSFSASSDAQDHAVELVVDQARRVAARGADAVVLIDTLDGLHPQAARKALAAARNIVDGGSLTVIATATAPVGGETTVIALDLALASTGRFPAVNLAASGTLRPELLVGDAGAEAIARARGEALEG